MIVIRERYEVFQRLSVEPVSLGDGVYHAHQKGWEIDVDGTGVSFRTSSGIKNAYPVPLVIKVQHRVAYRTRNDG